MSARIVIRDVDRGFAKLMRTASAKARHMKVGILGPLAQAPKEGALYETLVEVMTRHEFGIGVPERSFIRGWFDEDIDFIRAAIQREAQEVLASRADEWAALDRLGLLFVSRIQERISNGIEPPNAPMTIARKGSSTPLIDTGQARSSISHEVE